MIEDEENIMEQSLDEKDSKDVEMVRESMQLHQQEK